MKGSARHSSGKGKLGLILGCLSVSHPRCAVSGSDDRLIANDAWDENRDVRKRQVGTGTKPVNVAVNVPDHQGITGWPALHHVYTTPYNLTRWELVGRRGKGGGVIHEFHLMSLQV